MLCRGSEGEYKRYVDIYIHIYSSPRRNKFLSPVHVGSNPPRVSLSGYTHPHSHPLLFAPPPWRGSCIEEILRVGSLSHRNWYRGFLGGDEDLSGLQDAIPVLWVYIKYYPTPHMHIPTNLRGVFVITCFCAAIPSAGVFALSVGIDFSIANANEPTCLLPQPRCSEVTPHLACLLVVLLRQLVIDNSDLDPLHSRLGCFLPWISVLSLRGYPHPHAHLFMCLFLISSYPSYPLLPLSISPSRPVLLCCVVAVKLSTRVSIYLVYIYIYILTNQK